MKYTAIVVWGIPNCDTVKKARTWLTDQGYDHVFHDFKKQGLPEQALDRWLNEAGWEKVLNRKGTSWAGFTFRCHTNSKISHRNVSLRIKNHD